MAREHDLTQGPLGRQILIFSIPLILSYLLQNFFSLADIAVVGQFGGTQALGAVGSTTLLVSMFVNFMIGMGSGVNVRTAHSLGTGRDETTAQTVHTAFAMSLAIGILLFLFGECFERSILRLMHTKPEYLEGAVTYLRIWFLGQPALAIFNYGSAVLSASGDTRRPFLYLTVSGVLNLLLNILFVVAFRMDVAGVACATVISQYLSAFLVLNALRHNSGAIRLELMKLRLSRERLASLLRISLPSAIQNAIFMFANLFIQTAVNSFDAATVAGISAALNADSLVYDVMAAFYTACASFMSRNLGAGDLKRVKRSFHISLMYSFGIGLMLSGILLLMGRRFLGLFAKDPAVVDAGYQRMVIMCLSYAFSAFMDCTIAASRGLGRSFVPMILVFLGSCVFRIVWISVVFAHFGTVLSLYLLYIFSWTVTAISEYIYYRRIARQIPGYM